MDHYIGLFAAYSLIAMVRFAILRLAPRLIPLPATPDMKHPGRELIYLALVVVAVIAVGQLYTVDLLIPRMGAWDGVTESINQVLIFSPVFVFLWLVKPSSASLYLARPYLGRRLVLGLSLALLALVIFRLATPAEISLRQLFAPLANPDNLDFLVQVFFEDLLIAVFLARFSALVSIRTTIVIVAVGFAAAHIPAFLAAGVQPVELLSLIADAALGIMVFGTVLITRDFLWIWPVHVVMDTTQLVF